MVIKMTSRMMMMIKITLMTTMTTIRSRVTAYQVGNWVVASIAKMTMVLLGDNNEKDHIKNDDNDIKGQE